jgi:hypothetical protein
LGGEIYPNVKILQYTHNSASSKHKHNRVSSSRAGILVSAQIDFEQKGSMELLLVHADAQPGGGGHWLY